MVTLLTVGIGLIVIENVCATPEQVLENGVTVMNVVTGILEILVPVKELILPVPERGTRPTAAFELVQL